MHVLGDLSLLLRDLLVPLLLPGPQPGADLAGAVGQPGPSPVYTGPGP
jgi:hypothetical protein